MSDEKKGSHKSHDSKQPREVPGRNSEGDRNTRQGIGHSSHKDKCWESEEEKARISPKIKRAERDRQNVHEEVMHIRECRSNIFIAAVGALAISATTGGLMYSQIGGVGENTPAGKNISLHLCETVFFAMTLALGLLFVGIIATFEKARSLNYRRAFIAVVDEKLAESPHELKNYPGWGKLAGCLQECETRARIASLGRTREGLMGLRGIICKAVTGLIGGGVKWASIPKEVHQCPKFKIITGKEDDKSDRLGKLTCWDEGLKEAREKTLLSVHSTLPGIIDSFMSFVNIVYLIPLLLCSLGVLITLAVCAHEWWNTKYEDIAVVCIAGLLFSRFLMDPRFWLERDEVTIEGKDEGKEELSKKRRSWAKRRFMIKFSLVFLLPLTAGAVLLLWNQDWLYGLPLPGLPGEIANLLVILTPLLICMSAATVLGVGLFFLRILHLRVRRGHYAYEAMRCGWKCAINNHHDGPSPKT